MFLVDKSFTQGKKSFSHSTDIWHKLPISNILYVDDPTTTEIETKEEIWFEIMK